MNTRSLDAVAQARTSPHFIRPLNDAYGFARIPATVRRLLADGSASGLPDDALAGLGPHIEAVILVFLDALGWRFIEPRLDDYPLLRHFVRNGAASKLTSLFPSTTAAHVTCIHTGLAPAQSGLYEWNMYEPRLDAVYQPLPFSLAGQSERDTLKGAVDPKLIYPQRTVYRDLTRHGVTSVVFQPREILPSTYSSVVCEGATMRAFKTLSEGLVNLCDAALARKGRQYYYFYFAGVDTVAHQYGPNSAHVDAEIDTILTVLERQVLGRLRGKAKNTALLITADHGVCETDPKTTVYLNLQMPEIRKFIKLNRRGEAIVPCGSPRDFFLHIEDPRLDEARALLEAKLAGRADVRPVSDLIAQGYFGPLPAAPEFLARVGNLVVLPYRGESVWWYERDRFEQRYLGHHGGLTPVEMEIPFLACDLSN